MKPLTLQVLHEYVNNGTPPGGFLTAVLENNLKEAFMMADEDNERDMAGIVRYCYNKIPLDCWGSPEKVKAWKGLVSLQNSP